MTIPNSYPRPTAFPDRAEALALLREAVAVVLILAGLVGLVVAGFLASPQLGVAALSVELIAAGVYLGLDRRS